MWALLNSPPRVRLHARPPQGANPLNASCALCDLAWSQKIFTPRIFAPNESGFDPYIKVERQHGRTQGERSRTSSRLRHQEICAASDRDAWRSACVRQEMSRTVSNLPKLEGQTMKQLLFNSRLLMAIALLASPALAQEPPPAAILKLSASETVNVGDMAKIAVDPSSNVQAIVFDVFPKPTKSGNFCWKDGDEFATLVCGADAPKGGIFSIVAAGNLNGKTVIASTTITFVVPSPPPVPPEPPGPVPPPNPPAPVAKSLWIVTLDDASTRTQQTAVTLSDATFWPGLAAAGHKYRQYDKSNPAAQPFLKFIPAGVAGPAVLFINAETNKLLEAGALPADAKGLAQIVAKLTGKTLDEETDR
jgi:hypothetical protein